MEDPARMIGQPLPDLGVLVKGVVVGDGVDDPAGRAGAVDGAEKIYEFLVGGFRHVVSDGGAVEEVEGSEQGGAAAYVVVGHGASFSGFHRQAGLGAVEGLDLGFSSMEATTAWAGGFM